MNARFTRALMALAVASSFVAFTAVAQNDSPQQRDEHRGDQQQHQGQNGTYNGQQQHQGQNGTYNGQQQQQNRPQEQQNRQQQPQTTQHQYQPQQSQQNGQYRGQEQQGHDNGQYRGEQQQNNQYRGQDQQQHENGQYRGQEQQRHDNDRYRGEERGDQRDSYRGQQQYRAGNRPQQWGRPPANRPNYNFRANDRNILRRYYANRFGSINRANRPAFRMGGYLPYEDLGFLSPVPPGAWGSLPPVPYGYEAGYWDGYVLIYDPNTGYILYVADLL